MPGRTMPGRAMSSQWALFRSLCRVIGGQDNAALQSAAHTGVLPDLIEMAAQRNLLPAMAMRISEQPVYADAITSIDKDRLHNAWRQNTTSNMQTSMQALKIARALNTVGISPVFLKGTAQLLTTNATRLGFRNQLDIDLVVPRDALRPTCEALIKSGYGFQQESTPHETGVALFHDVSKALKISAAHHHLPPLVMAGYGSSVEVHRHFLPKQVQHKNPLQPMLDASVRCQNHGAVFQVPSIEYQIIHIVMGKLVCDGYLARRDFPIREACDYIHLLDSARRPIDHQLVTRHCGNRYALFAGLVAELMAYESNPVTGCETAVQGRLRTMERRYESGRFASLLNAHARASYLIRELLYSPSKLPAYLHRAGHP